jgi:F0F1-type ATP synthase assembly protein I
MAKKKQKTESTSKQTKEKAEQIKSTIKKNKVLDELIGGAILLSAL